MAEYQQRDNSGSVFKNNRKEKDTHPDYTGSAMIDGKQKQVSMWIKEGKSGKFFSVSFQEPYVKPAQESAKANGYQAQELDDDEALPF